MEYGAGMSEADEPTDRPTESLEVEGEALRGLAHPLRARILDELSEHGPATATILGKRLGESSGSTSYHLRQLARFGFVVADTGRTGSRDRWWRVRPGGWHMRGGEMRRSPATREAADIVLGRYYRTRRERVERWNALAREQPESPSVQRWSAASQDSVLRMRMTPEETREFAQELMAFVRERLLPYQGRTAEEWPDTEPVELQTDLFPNLPETAGDGTTGATESAGSTESADDGDAPADR
ncbi:helix-turn-helix domain-containing protein [Nocardiopsis oceani]